MKGTTLMSVENFKRLITELGANVGLPDLAPDEDNYSCLGFDDKIIVHLQYNKDHEVMMMFCQIGIVDEAYREYIFPRVLKANMFWQGTGGATLGADEDSGEILMSYQANVQFMEYPKFQELLEGFINTAELWIKTLESVQKGEAPQFESGKGDEGGEAAGFSDQPMVGIRA